MCAKITTRQTKEMKRKLRKKWNNKAHKINTSK